jgi:hypothetical protein
MITDSSRFVGRREELRFLAGRMAGAQPTSVNVVGERRMGKSSLLYHFFQTWEQRISSPTRFVVVYLDLQARTPSSEAAFYQTLGRSLARQPAVQRVESLHQGGIPASITPCASANVSGFCHPLGAIYRPCSFAGLLFG